MCSRVCIRHGMVVARVWSQVPHYYGMVLSVHLVRLRSVDSRLGSRDQPLVVVLL